MSKIVIVGGSSGKVSGIVSKLHDLLIETKKFQDIVVYNGALLPTDVSDADLLLWFPDISNEEPKDYPIKGKGAVLICSKVMRDETTRIDAVTRIFKMHGNAVTAIRRSYEGSCTDCVYVGKAYDDSRLYCGMEYGDGCSVHNKYKKFVPKPKATGQMKPTYEFELIDALNNNWTKTTDLKVFVDAVLKLYEWTKNSQRRSLTHVPEDSAMWSSEEPEGLEDFMSINRELALKVAAGCGNRYFGNFSTRCTKLFPSKKVSPTAFAFSPRNVDKRSITSKDLVLTSYKEYFGDRKPSVDAPVQLELYRHNPDINFMIHGHAYIKYCAANTQEYFPCGDLREVDEVLGFLEQGATRVNLCNHGFLLVGKTVADFYRHLNECSFEMI